MLKISHGRAASLRGKSTTPSAVGNVWTNAGEHLARIRSLNSGKINNSARQPSGKISSSRRGGKCLDRRRDLVKIPHVHRQPSGKVNNSARGQRWRRIISGQAVVVQCLAQHGLSLARVQRLARRICALKTAHRLRLCIACSKTFPGYLAAAFDIFCCISPHARRVALSGVRSTVGLCDCLFH